MNCRHLLGSQSGWYVSFVVADTMLASYWMNAASCFMPGLFPEGTNQAGMCLAWIVRVGFRSYWRRVPILPSSDPAQLNFSRLAGLEACSRTHGALVAGALRHSLLHVVQRSSASLVHAYGDLRNVHSTTEGQRSAQQSRQWIDGTFCLALANGT